MKLVDSSGWVEFAMGGPLAGRYQTYLDDLSQIVTPSIVLYEVYKRLKQGASEEAADAIIAKMSKTQIVPLDDRLALQAADAGLSLNLAMGDAIIYATAQAHHATIITSDADFKNLPQVVYLKK